MKKNKNIIPYGRQAIDLHDIESVVDVLNSDFLTQGPKIKEFEDAISSFTGAKFCVALSNGTAALHLAVAALEIQDGCEGITSPISFVASSNSMIYNNLNPVFADIDFKNRNVDLNQIKSKITSKTRLILPVHFAGRPVDMQSIAKLALINKISVIEDAAHAIGSAYETGGKVGNCKYSDMTIFSFHPVKTITSAEGGAITTNSKYLYEKLLMLRSHGITKDQEVMSKNPGSWYYEMQSLGYNYRITDMQAALGVSQLKKIDYFKKIRCEIYQQYNEELQGVEFIDIPEYQSNVCYHLYVLWIDFDKINKSRDQVMKELRAQGVGSQVHYIPIHLQPYYKEKFGYKTGDFPQAEKYYNGALTLPLFPTMRAGCINKVIKAVKNMGAI